MSPGTLQGRVGSARPIYGNPGSNPSDADVLGAGSDGDGDDEAPQITPWVDYFVVRSLGPQTFRLTYQPMDKSEHFYWNGVYQPKPGVWTRDKWTVTVPDTEGRLELEDVITIQYLTNDLTPRQSELITFDIPASTIYAYNHAGAPGVITPNASTALISEDGDSSYVSYVNQGLTGGTAGYGLFVKFPPTPVPGDLVKTELVIQAKGQDSRFVNRAYDMSNYGSVLADGPVALMTARDPAAYNTPPNYGYIAGANWVGIRGSSQDLGKVRLPANGTFHANGATGLFGGADGVLGDDFGYTNIQSSSTGVIGYSMGLSPLAADSYDPADAIKLRVRMRMQGGGTPNNGHCEVFIATDSAGTNVVGIATDGNFSGLGFKPVSVTASIAQETDVPVVAAAGKTMADVFAALEAGAYLVFNKLANESTGATSSIVNMYEADLYVGDVPYVETITPLKFPLDGSGDARHPDPSWPEFITKEMIEDGHVEYNPNQGFYISDSFRGDGTNPGAKGEMRFSYVALRVTYSA